MKTKYFFVNFKGIKHKVFVDNNDLIKVKDHSWWLKYESGYVYTQINRKTIYLHRFLLKPNKDKQVDHINHNKHDNRRINLRECTMSQNNMNKIGIRGVSKFRNKWRARIKINNKEKHLGIFNTRTQAITVRKHYEKILFGNFANI